MKRIESKVIYICSVILIASSTMFSYSKYEDYNDSTNQYTILQESIKNQTKYYIKTILDENIDKTKTSLSYYTDIIYTELLEGYDNNLSKLEEDINNPLEDTELIRIIDKILEDVYVNVDSNGNRPIVASLENILWNRSIPFTYNFEKNKIISWNDFADNHYNKRLASTAIDAIKSMNKVKYEYIFWEASSNHNDDHEMIDSMDIDDLLEVYEEEGLDGLKSYELLISSYITNTGDIFGTNDSNTLGHKMDNYKIIIIQRVNIYDLLYKNINNLNKFTNELVTLEVEMKDTITSDVYEMIQSIILIVIILFSSSYIHRRFRNL